jgi:signal transduction histidine kinase
MMIWPLSNFLINYTEDASLQYLILRFAFCGVALLGYGWLWFSVVLTSGDACGIKPILITLVPVLVFMVLILLNPNQAFMEPFEGSYAVRIYGPLFWAVIIGLNLYLVSACVILIRSYKRNPLIRNSLRMILYGILLLFLFVTLDIFFNVMITPEGPPVVGLTSAGMVASIICFVIAIRRYNGFQVIDMTLRDLILNMQSGIFVVDSDFRIQEANQRSKLLISGRVGELFDLDEFLQVYQTSIMKLQDAEKMQLISELAASVAHEVRNPLQVTRGFLQLLAEKNDVQNKTYFQTAIQELDRASSIISAYLNFAKPEMDQTEIIDVAAEIRNLESIINSMVIMSGLSLTLELQEQVHMTGNVSKLKQILINLIKNSVEAIDKSPGLIVIIMTATESELQIVIRDNGTGMDKNELSKLGTPYYSSKTLGTGLGLMVTYRIVEEYNGTLKFHSEKGKGTEALLTFPTVI